VAYITVAVIVATGIYAVFWLWQVKSLGVTINWTGQLLSVQSGTLAEQAGLQPGDYVTFHDFQRLKQVSGEAHVGQLVNVVVFHAGAWRDVTLEAVPSPVSRLLSLGVEAVVGILFAILGLAPLVARRQGFSLWLFFIATQLTALYLITDVPRAYHQLWAEIIAYTTLPLFPAVVFHFHTLFPQPRLGRWRRPLVVLIYAVAGVLLPLDLISLWDYSFYVSDAWQYIISTYQAVVLLACVGLVVRTFVTTRDARVRAQLRIVTICIVVGLLIPALVVVPVIMFDLDTSDTLKSLSIFSALVVPAGYAYSMMRYKLLIGGLLWRPSLIRVMYTSLLSLGLVALVMLVWPSVYALSGNAALIVWAGMVLLVVALAALLEWLGHWTERHLFKGSSYVDLLASATDELQRFHNLDEYVSFFTETLRTRLRIAGSLVFLSEKPGDSLVLRGYSRALRLSVRPEDVPAIAADSELRAVIQEAPPPVSLSSLLTHDLSSFAPADVKLLEIMRGCRVEVLLPLMSTRHSKLIGLVALGGKETDEPYSSQELTALAALARTASISAENVLWVAAIEEEREYSAALARSVSATQERERKRISRDLHDSTLQDLGTISRALTELREQVQDMIATLEEQQLEMEAVSNVYTLSRDRHSSGTRRVRKQVLTLLSECQMKLGAVLGEDARLAGALRPDGAVEANTSPEQGGTGLDVLATQPSIEGLIAQMRATSQRVRAICNDLHPTYLDVPLAAMLRNSVAQFSNLNPGISIEMNITGEEPVLRPSGWTQMGLRLVNSPDWLE
jgi:signal transduction histidine kinase